MRKFIYLLFTSLFVITTMSACSSNKQDVVIKNEEVVESIEETLDFTEDLDKPVVDKTYDDGTITQLEEEFVKAEVKGNTLYISLDKTLKWTESEYDRNVLGVLFDLENGSISVKGLKEGHSALILKGSKEGVEVESTFNIIVNPNQEISFSQGCNIQKEEEILNENEFENMILETEDASYLDTHLSDIPDVTESVEDIEE